MGQNNKQMKNSIETIWQEGFLKNEALVAPKLNDLYNQKSIHIVDKFRRMYKINIMAIFVFALLILPFSYFTNIPYMGIPMFFLFSVMVIYSAKFKNKLDKIETSQNSYQYLSSFNMWIKEMVSFNTKMSRYLYPYVFLSMVIGFWFGSFGGDIPGEVFVNWLLEDYPNMNMVFGIPLLMLIGGIIMIVILAFFGGRIGKWDINLVYGRIIKKLDRMMSEMEDLKATG